MKKSTIAMLVGAVIISTFCMLVNKQESMYQKKKVFSSAEEIIEQLDGIQIRDNKSHDYTEDILECVSQRKRLTSTGLDGGQSLEIQKVLPINDTSKQSILEDYHTKKAAFTKAREVSNEEVVRLKVVYIYSESHNGEKESVPEYMDLVLIDEGEGLVIDYVQTYAESQIIDESSSINEAKDDENA